jgi:hypothetical protein
MPEYIKSLATVGIFFIARPHFNNYCTALRKQLPAIEIRPCVLGTYRWERNTYRVHLTNSGLQLLLSP